MRDTRQFTDMVTATIRPDVFATYVVIVTLPNGKAPVVYGEFENWVDAKAFADKTPKPLIADVHKLNGVG